MAGYRDQIWDFIHTNPGLRSRFTRYIDFPDFSADELTQIFVADGRRGEGAGRRRRRSRACARCWTRSARSRTSATRASSGRCSSAPTRTWPTGSRPMTGSTPRSSGMMIVADLPGADVPPGGHSRHIGFRPIGAVAPSEPTTPKEGPRELSRTALPRRRAARRPRRSARATRRPTSSTRAAGRPTTSRPGASTGGLFGLYRWNMGVEPSGPGPHYHRTIAESFYVLDGHREDLRRARVASTAGRATSSTCRRAGSTGSATSRASRRRCCCHFAPGAPREALLRGPGAVRRGGPAGPATSSPRFYAEHDNTGSEPSIPSLAPGTCPQRQGAVTETLTQASGWSDVRRRSQPDRGVRRSPRRATRPSRRRSSARRSRPDASQTDAVSLVQTAVEPIGRDREQDMPPIDGDGAEIAVTTSNVCRHPDLSPSVDVKTRS